ncbi:MAG TPA: DHA2 family efflux MFS transporter permease subunit [Conexibacter sp.]|nr:DHA2 family efflux MFS transporter permease subunit [Conexibacter sp.]
MSADSTTGQIAFDSGPGRWVLTIAVLGSGIAFLDGTVVNVALPAIGEDLNASTSELQWMLNGYLLTLASLILLGGSLGDRVGRRRIFVFGTAWFTLASGLCALAPSAEVLIAARLLQGIGGALLTPGSLAMIEGSFQRVDRPRAIGAWSGLTGVGAALGPLLGGWLVDAVSWRAVFLINLPLGLFVCLTAPRRVPETRDPTAHGRLDVLGAVLTALGLAGTTFALIQAPDGVTAAVSVAAIGGVLALVAFVLHERRVENPMLPLSLFANRQFSAANVVTVVVYAALSGMFFLLVSFLQISLGYSPLAAGAASLPVTALMLTLSARSGALAQAIGPRIPLTLGPFVIAVAMLLMTRIEPGDTYLASVLPPVLVFGMGLTLVVAPITATVLAAADQRHAGIASGINNAVSRVAGLLAVAVLPIVGGLTGGDAFYDPAAMTDGFHTAMVVTAALAVLGGVIAWLTIDPRVLEPEPEPPHYQCPVSGAPLRAGHEAPEAAQAEA